MPHPSPKPRVRTGNVLDILDDAVKHPDPRTNEASQRVARILRDQLLQQSRPRRSPPAR